MARHGVGDCAGRMTTRGIVTALALGQRKDNLPGQVTRFIGRRRELPAIAAAIERHRLVTLRGAAGVGKTRLALRAARDVRDTFADGCWLVELSALRTPGLLPRTIAAALGLPEEASGDTAEILAASLAERELLLVLDTCEHLLDDCAALAQVLLSAVPGLRILTTSREPLGVPGEHALLITPLELPGNTDPLGNTVLPGHTAQASQTDAVALFVDRGQAAVPGFTLTQENAAAVAMLCRRLDGIPLALELAAVRLRSMPVQEILDLLDDRFRALGSARTATSRHRTLRAAVDWSYELCTPAEQWLWSELSVFPGSFGLEAAEHVCGPGTLETLIRLVEKSVVQYDHRARRYHLLDTMREFGAERLAGPAFADARRELEGRHRDYYLGLARQSAADSLSDRQASWLARLSAETDNLRAALGYSFTTPGQQGAGLELTTLLRDFWRMVGQFTEGRRWHDLAVAAAPGSGDHDWAVYGAGILAVHQGDLAAAEPFLDRAAALAAGNGDENLAAHVADALGMTAFYRGDLETARARYEGALASYERIGFSDSLALAIYVRLGGVHLLAFELDEAVRLSEECLRRCDELGEQWARASALWVRGAARRLAGDIPAAMADALACLRIKDALGALQTIAMSFDLLADCLMVIEDLERAAVLYGAGEALWALLNTPALMGPGYAGIRKIAADTGRGRLGEERFKALVSRGFALPLSAAIAVAAGEAPADLDVAAPDGDLGTAADDGTAAEDPQARPLTGREREIAHLAAAGLSNREIAGRLVLSKRTVDSHIDHIFTKLGFSSRTQLVGWAYEEGNSTSR
jgi:predicted ATPase/DNA-binding CsgD family transcriptional regulator